MCVESELTGLAELRQEMNLIGIANAAPVRTANSATIIPLPRNLRPLIILDSPELSGPAKGLLQILSVMAANSIDPLVVNFRYSGRVGEFSSQARAQGTTVMEVEQRSRLDWTFLSDIVASATRHGVNLVQSHSFKATVAAFMICRRTRWPWVAFAHGYTWDRWRARLYNRAEQLIMRRLWHPTLRDLWSLSHAI